MPRLSDDLNELAEAVQRVSDALEIPESHVEKDFWITEAVRSCVVAAPRGVDVVLKGGTSLSKAYGLIRRFSEDVDVVLVFQPGRTRRARHEVMRSIAQVAGEALGNPPEVIRSASETGVKRPVFLAYPSTHDPAVYGLRPQGVLLELGTRGGTLPTTALPISSLVATHAESVGLPTDFDEFSPVTLRVLDPSRTLVEKLLILHEAATGDSDERVRITSRHYHDVHQLLGHEPTVGALAQHGVTMLVNDVASRSGEAGLGIIEPPSESLADSPAFEVATAVVAKDEYDTQVLPNLLWPGSRHPSFEECCERVREHRDLLAG